MNDIAVIGIGFRLPSGNLKKSLSAPNELWNSLLNGFDGTLESSERWSNNYYKIGDIASKYAGLISMEEIKSFDPIFFKINPSEVPTIDPQQRLLLKCTWEALEDSGIDPLSLRGTNTSVFIGSSTTDYFQINKPSVANEILPNIFGSSAHSCANRISYCFDLRGESITIDTACSSSLNAINMGYNSIINGKSKVSVCGGCNLLFDPNISKSFSYLSMLSPNGKCKTFSADADGYVRSEGVGVVILKSLSDAIKDGNNIYCVIKGSSSNVDGNFDKSNFYSPSKSVQCENIKLAIKSTNGSVSSSDIDYFECHGTGTPTGDPLELEGISMAIKDSNRKQPLLIGSIKSNVGHGEAVSGVTALIKSCLIFKNQCFVQNINFNKPNPLIKFDEWNLKVVTEPIKFNQNKTTITAINNFGVTGSNCCLILSQYSKKDTQLLNSNKFNKKYLIPFSANSSKSLETYKEMVMNLSESCLFEEFVSKQILFKPNSLVQRTLIVADCWEDFKNEKNETKSSSDKISNISMEKKNPTTIFVFSGQGSQYNKMNISLYENVPMFKQSIDKFDKLLSNYYGYSIWEKLKSIKDDDLISINEPILAQPATIMIQIALFELYKSWGINCDIVVGHSLGELSSAYCSGMIDYETLCYLTYHRAVGQQKTVGYGKMLSINIGPDEYMNNYSSKYPTLEIACYNSPGSIVVVGKETLLKDLIKELKSKDVFCAILGSLSPFHSSNQLMIKDYIKSLEFKSKNPTIPVFSSVSSNLFDDNLKYDIDYVFNNLLKPVNFTQTVSNIYSYIEEKDLGNEVVFIEIASHPALKFYLDQMKSQQSEYYKNGEKISIYSPCNKKKNDHDEFLKTISLLYVNNGFNNLNFKSQLLNLDINSNIELPLYQWDEKQYWKTDASFKKINENGPSTHHLGNQSEAPFISYETFIDIKKPTFSWLKGHMVKDKYYFPGCGYINNLLNIYPNQDITISNMEFKSPLVLKNNFNQCLQTTINSIGKNEFNIKNHFKDSKTNQWVLSSIGNFNLFNHGNEIEKLDMEQIKKLCSFTKVSKEEVYNNIKNKTGLNYKDLFQGVKECYIGKNCSLSIVSLNEINQLKEYNYLNENNFMKSFFNTAILDTCLHGMICMINYHCQLVFDKVEDLKFYSSNIPKDLDKYKEVYVYSIQKPRTIPSSFSGSIQILLEDGTLLIEITNAVCTSLVPVIDYTDMISPPINEIYVPYLQENNSIINTISFKHLYEMEEFKVKEDDSLIPIETLLSLLYENINTRRPEINIVTLSTITYNQFKDLYFNSSINENYFIFIFECLKKYKDIASKEKNNVGVYELSKDNLKYFINSTRVIAKQIFPLESDDTDSDSPQSMFENGLLDDFYNSSKVLVPANKLLSEVVLELIKPLVNKPIVIKILEFGGGDGSLSCLVLEKINKLLIDNPSNQIDIEYTWSDISSSFFLQIKEKLSNIKRINVIYKALDLDQDLIETQGLKPSYYDIIVMSNVMHVTKNLKFTLNQIYRILNPNGQLIYVEPPYKSIYYDCIFGIFSQWWVTDDQVRTDRACIKQEQWNKLLNECNYIDTCFSTNNDSLVTLIQTRKPNVNEIIANDKELLELTSFDKIVIIGNNETIISKFKSNNNLENKIIMMDTYNELNDYIMESTLSIRDEKTLILFSKPINDININNFKEITYEYVQINQLLLFFGEFTKNYKHVLLTLNSTSNNYLSSSLIGAARYFYDFPQLDINILDFDNQSIENQDLLALLNYLIDSNINNEKEFKIQNNKIYFETYKQHLNIKEQFKSNTFENKKENLIVQLDSNLQYKLVHKSNSILSNQIEVEIKGTGVNYKDYLMYIGMIGQNIDFNHGNGLDNDGSTLRVGNDFSGVITRVGSDVKKLKIGDEVYGIGTKTNGSHVVLDYRCVYNKPSNISHVEAASLPTVYITCIHSIYYIGNLQPNETILIHSAAGGIGLSALEILKWKNHKGHIFVTVSSKDKEEYLRNTYGSLITDIYSSKNKKYVHQIKNKLKELDVEEDHQGVDLILNTLSAEFMDSNFKCLNFSGRITDLSITHLTPNDYMDYNKFKFNYGYHNVELVEISLKLTRYYLKKLYKPIQSGELKLIPIVEFSNQNFKEAIQRINQRKHIGKIVVNHDKDMVSELFNEQLNNNSTVVLKKNYDISKLNFGKNILVTGQTGIILEIMKWLVKYSNQSIENLIILSKSKLKWELELLINQTKNQRNNKINFHFFSIDIENSNDMNMVFDQLEMKSNISNIDSIIHFAFINDICDVQQIDLASLNKVHGPKTIGAVNLHEESIKRKWNMKQFIMASSAISILGSDTQCSYVSANSVIDSLSKYRKSIGLPSLSVNMGAISSVGFVSRNEAIEEMFGSTFLKLFTPQLILSSIDLLSQNIDKYSNYCLSDFSFEYLASTTRLSNNFNKFSYHINKFINRNQTNSLLNNKTGKSNSDSIKSELLSKISELLSIEESKLNLDYRLLDYGLDSLVIVQLKNHIDSQYGPNLITIQQLQNNKITQSIEIIVKELKTQNK